MNARFFHIARNTFRECLRQPIFLILLLAACTLIGTLPGATLFVFREQVKLVTDSGMATTLLFGLIASVLCAGHTVGAELRAGTALLLLSKPVNRNLFVAAKIAGVLGAIVIFWYLCATSTLLAVRVATDQFRIDTRVLTGFFGALAVGCAYGGIRNYVSRASFCAEAVSGLIGALTIGAAIAAFLPASGGGTPPGLAWELFPALLLLLEAVLVFAALAVTLSTRLDWTGTLLVCFAVFVIGLMSDYLIGRFAAGNFLLGTLYALVPNWQLFWMADPLAAEQTIPWRYVRLGGVYAALMIALLSLLACALFSGREVGNKQGG